MARPIWKYVIVAICGIISIVVLIFVIGVIIFVNQTSGHHSIPQNQLTDMPNHFAIGWGMVDVPPMSVERAERDATFTGAGSEWYLLKMSGPDVGRFKQAVISHYSDAEKRKARSIASTNATECFAAVRWETCPSWWQPESLPDAEAVKIDPYPRLVFIFSAQTGTVYWYAQGH
jgi:hypothetical protein